jgi:peptidoglycan LD-endopeptidase LytH
MYIAGSSLYERLASHANSFHKVVDFNPVREKMLRFDFTSDNKELAEIDLKNTETFTRYIQGKLKNAHARFGIGGYNELRVLYESSALFSPPSVFKGGKEYVTEPRSVHLGIDIWGDEGTKVYAPLGGMIHSFAVNNNWGDYGAAIVLLHQIDSYPFYTIYGHLCVKDIARLREGTYISRGQQFGHFGNAEENGNWPPHLHFQIIKDMRMYKGDYPGVCKLSERKQYLENCPDADVILNMMQYV